MLSSAWRATLSRAQKKTQTHRVSGGTIMARFMLDFLAAPDTIKVMKAKGLDPAS